MVLQAQVSVLIDDGNSVKFCKNEEFELSVNYTMFKEKHSRHMFFYFIAIETFFFQVFHLATSCSFIFLQYYFILLYTLFPFQYPSPLLLLHLIFQNTNSLEKILTKILKRFSVNVLILRLCYQPVTLQKWTHDLVTKSPPSPC
jgi:hypothetical protein